jgi:transcriptional regulator GlxA family with amidase domain
MSPTLVRLLERLLAEPAAPLALRTLRAYEILYRYVFDAEHRESTRRSLALEAALTFVEQHLDQPIDVAQVASASAVSRPHLFRLFREQLGLTPAQYLWERRVERAVELLRETGLPVADVALLCGFSNPKHLARRVRAATGASPVGVRAQALQPDRE